MNNNNNNNSTDNVLSRWLRSNDWFLEIFAPILIGQNKSFGYSFLPSSKTVEELSSIFKITAKILIQLKEKSITKYWKTKTNLYAH